MFNLYFGRKALRADMLKHSGEGLQYKLIAYC